MEELRALYFAALEDVAWCQPEHLSFSGSWSRRWLLEQGSLSRLLAEECQQLGVELLRNQPMPAEQLTEQESDRLGRQTCLVREVILRGDDSPWVLARTLIPHTSLTDQNTELASLGEIPLGQTVFSAENVRRDALEVGVAHTPQGDLLARRSRLWMNDKPMLVAELFLPRAPLYTREMA